MPLSRRSLLLASAATVLAPRSTAAMPSRRRAGSGIELPLLGLGTWQSFDVAAGSPEAAETVTALRTLAAAGGGLVDTSPMYGRAEAALGFALAALPEAASSSLLLASKIWTRGKSAGLAQLARTQQLLKRRRIDLMQIHNLLDAETHFASLQAARERGEVRWVGLTHYQSGAHAELEGWLKKPGLDAIQINYSLAEPQAGTRLLPAALAAGRAVLINRPFAEGAMFDRVRGRELPAIATELGCSSFAQLFLKWIFADPAVTCALAGTRNSSHLLDNLAAAEAPLPDVGQRAQIGRWWNSL